MKKSNQVKQNTQLNTDFLITQLSEDISQSNTIRLAKPRDYILKNILIFIVYMIGLQLTLGLRPDLMTELKNPSFTLEIFLLAGLCLTSLSAAIFNMYPDHYQNTSINKIVYIFLFVFAMWMFLQLLIDLNILKPFWANSISMNSSANISQEIVESTHTFECLLCIFASAVLPFCILIYLLKKGAPINPKAMAFMLAVTAFSVAALSLRLAEVMNDVQHLLIWHYTPALLASCAVAIAGRLLFKWY